MEVTRKIVFEYWDESKESIDNRIKHATDEMAESGYSLIKRNARTIPDGDRIRRHILSFVKE